ncbi:FTR1 family iron permease [Brevibacillus laterosporus]|uniref:FTR1 family iron permease n=1 Tax=Brevibacillus laterosporus TaxID=1465 RepID=UPI0014448E0D|nr:FTR1 family protein [Brevibacillus laterosporus]NKQ19568.1 hypothetical protein [Brevibacillus laterosporus]WNX32355.1 FTR1 family protein [Brevibacillus laterosporus]
MWFSKSKQRIMAMLMVAAFLVAASMPVWATEATDRLFVTMSDAFLKLKEQDWAHVETTITTFAGEWAKERTDIPQAKEVDNAIAYVQAELQKETKDDKAIYAGLQQLSKSLRTYEETIAPPKKEENQQKLKDVLAQLEKWQKDVNQQSQPEMLKAYQSLDRNWTRAELIVRNKSIVAYGDIEKQMAFVRIALNAEPLDLKKVAEKMDGLHQSIQAFLDGKTSGEAPAEGTYSVQSLLDLLSTSISAIGANDNATAIDTLNQFLTIWPLVEGEIMTRAPSLYAKVENEIPLAISELSSKVPKTSQATDRLTQLQIDLAPYVSSGSYHMWDAAVILLREGFEALIIVAALLSFLKKTNHAHQQKWIWAGVIVGIICSGLLAVGIQIFFSQATAGASREYLEGVFGIAAVVMMVLVGNWLHNKSNIQNWNVYLKGQVESAVAKGGLWAMATVSFLAIFREGAETVIFYIGLAPSITMKELLAGIALALAILVVVGFVLIRYSVKLPIRLFFTTATVVIYALAFKIVGVSVHALQITKSLPVHPISQVPLWEGIGLFPTMETVLSQGILLIIVLGVFIWTHKRAKKPVIPA